MQLATCHPNRKLIGHGLCKNCYDKHLKEVNPAYKERQLANKREWYKKNSEEAKKKERERNRKRSQDPNHKLKVRRYTLKRQYGITIGEYEEMLAQQNNSCALCFRKQGKANFHVDHCHKTGRVRGILCHQCNWYLGTIEEDLAIMNRIKEYLGVL